MNCVQCQPKTYRTHFPLSLESFQDLLQKLPEHNILGKCSYLGDSYYDMPDHALLTDQPCRGGRWLRFRQVNEDEKNAFWNIRSCHAVEKDNIICHEDIAGEMAIIEKLYPEPATRPKSLRNVNLELYARIRSARFTFELAKAAKLMIECAQLGPKKYALLGTIVAPTIDTLEDSLKSISKISPDAATLLSTQSKILQFIHHRDHKLYELLCERRVIPNDATFQEWHLVDSPPIDMGIPPSAKTQARLEHIRQKELMGC